MKRDCSRFTLEELKKVISNWDSVSKEYNGEIAIKKTTLDHRPLALKVVDKENIDPIESILYIIEVKIPFKGKDIKIITSEIKTPVIQYSFDKIDFSFTISNEDYFERLLKLFGSNELQTEDYEFDKKYLLDTNDKPKLKKFLDNKIRSWLKEISICYFDLDTPKSKKKLSLYGVINELSDKKIRKQIDMFKYCIDKLYTTRMVIK